MKITRSTKEEEDEEARQTLIILVIFLTFQDQKPRLAELNPCAGGSNTPRICRILLSYSNRAGMGELTVEGGRGR